MNLRFPRKYFLKLFLLIFVICFLTIGIALYTGYYAYTSARSDQYQAAVADSLSVSDQMFTTLLTEVDMLYTLLLTNEQVQRFFQGPGISETGREQLEEYLRNIRTLNPYVESIAFYKPQKEEYIFSGPYHVDMQPYIGTYLKDMSQVGGGGLSNLSKHKNIFRYTALVSDEGSEADLMGQVIGVMYYNVDAGGNESDSVVINLNALKVSEHILPNLNTTSLLLNEYGTIIAANRVGQAVPLRNRIRWGQKFFAETRRTGHFVEDLEGKAKLVTYYKLSDCPWVLYEISDDLRFHPFDSRMRLFLIPIIMVALLFSLLITALSSTRLYKPVDAMFTDLSSRIATLETENTGYLSNEKLSFLRSVINNETGRWISRDDWDLYGIQAAPENLFISIIKWDEDENAVLSETVFENLIKESADRCLKEQYRFETVVFKKDEIVLLMNARTETGDLRSGMIDALERFHGFVCRSASIPVSISIGVGGMSNGIKECEECCRAAQELLKQRFVLGYGRIITGDYVKAVLSRGLNYPGELIDVLELNIRECKKDEFMRNYGKLLDILGKYIYQEVVSVLLQVITRCLHAMNSISANNIPIKVDFDEFNRIFSTLHTLEHTRAWFSRMFDEYLLAIENLESLMKNDKHHQLTIQIQEYVTAHYAEANLNVDSLADSFGYTANHISKIFKNLTGLYLRDYIKDVRIQHAKDMLKNSSISLQEISAMTGFSNYNYFFSSFKKESGLTPMTYRSRFIAP
ncbi:hypothetical protein FACS1894110_00290 [Spirochaetia bacterium]|nr:hypothetical protein FACS1894110_00290 [Spirochaetia bacterium]